MTRNGKIARLPGSIREELNRRFREGEKAPVMIPSGLTILLICLDE